MNLFVYKLRFQQVLFTFFTVFILALFAGYGLFGYGPDHSQYIIFHDVVSRTPFEYLDVIHSRFEQGFVYLSWAITRIFDSQQGYFTTIIFLSLLLKFSLIFKERNSLILFIIYLLTLFPLHELVQLRISLALAVTFTFFYYSLKHDFNILIRIAFLFFIQTLHESCILFAPFILLQRFILIYPKLTYFLIFLALFAINPIANYIISSDRYLEELLELANSSSFNMFSLRSITFLTLLLIGFVFIRKFNQKEFFFYTISLSFTLAAFVTYWFPLLAHRTFEMALFSYFFWVQGLPKPFNYLALLMMLGNGVYFFYKFYLTSPLFTHLSAYNLIS